MRFTSICSLLLCCFSSLAFADRYSIHENDNYSGNSGFDIVSLLGAIACSIFAYWFLANSYAEWKARKVTDKKVERTDFVGDIIIPFIGYAVIAFFISFPIVMIIKFFGSVILVKSLWIYVGMTCFAVIAFLRQT